MILRGHDGVGDFGGDLFPIRNPKGTGYYCLGNGRGTGGPDAAQRAILAPGPDGPVATERFENFREGTELAEAILFLEKAIQDGAIDGPLAAKVNRYLDERSECFRNYWYERGANFISRWSLAGQTERDVRLLALCARSRQRGASGRRVGQDRVATRRPTMTRWKTRNRRAGIATRSCPTLRLTSFPPRRLGDRIQPLHGGHIQDAIGGRGRAVHGAIELDGADQSLFLAGRKDVELPLCVPTYTLPSATSVEPHTSPLMGCDQYSWPVFASRQ